VVDTIAEADRPVFVLTMARSGSTLLRFILDTHPDLACPPETNVGHACLAIARLREILSPSPELAGRDFKHAETPANLSPGTAASIRAVVDTAFGGYAAQRGKRRWCDKSLDSAGMAGLLAELYPQAQFVCLYRHCMDVVASTIESAPWGLNGYGFDPYVAGSPGNLVMATARAWLDQTKTIIDFQAKNVERCHGIRYEDLVTDPEGIAEGLFEFLGHAHVPGITAACFAQEHDERGPGDHKIWFTSTISRGSLGRGTTVPTKMFPPELLTMVNETLAQLEYRQVDDAWKGAVGALDPRADVETASSPAERADAAELEAAAEISRRLAAVDDVRARELAKRWPAAADRNLALVIETPGNREPCRWALSYDDCALTVRADAEPVADATTLAASADTWLALLRGEANMAVELRTRRLRLLDPSAEGQPDGPGDQTAVTHLLAHLIGLAGQAPAPQETRTTR
jgi:hypothetical protein